tara:strand:+ start:60 stop:290 length:231 start_codon:yes stop_codon:yes gene_type:complete
MVWNCALCEKENVYVVKVCDKCRRIKNLINLYGDVVYNVLERVLVVDETEQKKRETAELKSEVTKRINKLKEDRTD